MTEEEREIVSGWFLLTDKPVIYAANIADSEIGQEESAHVKAVREIARPRARRCLPSARK